MLKLFNFIKYYVDKSLFIEELFNKGDQVTLLPRPRRFGKTLNLSMLKCYFDIRENNRDLFKGLKIEKSNIYEKHLNKYPTIFLTFKEIKGNSWNKIYNDFKFAISKLYEEHSYLLESEKLTQFNKDIIYKIMREEGSVQHYENSLKILSEYIYKYYNKEVVILLDEYDSSLNNIYDKKTYDNIIGFMRVFIGSAFKGNDYLFKGIITGILRIAKESMFSGANNIMVRTILDDDFSDKFGFSNNEVLEILKYYNSEDKIEDVRNWYNGYKFSNNIVYNPYSIISYITSNKRILKNYWINTGDDALIKNLLNNSDDTIKDKLDILIEDGTIEENIAFNKIEKPKYLWSLLLFSGYLKALKNYNGKYLLSIPNKEIKSLYSKIREEYFTEANPNLAITMNKISFSILNNNIKAFGEEIENLLMSKLSLHDIAKNKENVYHVIILLSLLRLEHENNYEVKSNIESGEGRYDISITPKDKNKVGYIIEIKIAKLKEDLKLKAEEAIRQIEKRRYVTELINKSIKNIVILNIAFRGKKAFIIDKKILL